MSVSDAYAIRVSQGGGYVLSRNGKDLDYRPLFIWEARLRIWRYRRRAAKIAAFNRKYGMK